MPYIPSNMESAWDRFKDFSGMRDFRNIAYSDSFSEGMGNLVTGALKLGATTFTLGAYAAHKERQWKKENEAPADVSDIARRSGVQSQGLTREQAMGKLNTLNDQINENIKATKEAISQWKEPQDEGDFLQELEGSFKAIADQANGLRDDFPLPGEVASYLQITTKRVNTEGLQQTFGKAIQAKNAELNHAAEAAKIAEQEELEQKHSAATEALKEAARGEVSKDELKGLIENHVVNLKSEEFVDKDNKYQVHWAVVNEAEVFLKDITATESNGKVSEFVQALREYAEGLTSPEQKVLKEWCKGLADDLDEKIETKRILIQHGVTEAWFGNDKESKQTEPSSTQASTELPLSADELAMLNEDTGFAADSIQTQTSSYLTGEISFDDWAGQVTKDNLDGALGVIKAYQSIGDNFNLSELTEKLQKKSKRPDDACMILATKLTGK